MYSLSSHSTEGREGKDRVPGADLRKTLTDFLRDCSLFMPKGGRCLEWGVKFSKSMKKGGCFF